MTQVAEIVMDKDPVMHKAFPCYEGWYFMEDIKTYCIWSIMNFIRNDQVDNESTLVQLLARYQIKAQPFAGPMMTSLHSYMH